MNGLESILLSQTLKVLIYYKGKNLALVLLWKWAKAKNQEKNNLQNVSNNPHKFEASSSQISVAWGKICLKHVDCETGGTGSHYNWNRVKPFTFLKQN